MPKVAEIRVVCGNCKQKYKIPAHVTIVDLKCLECGSLLSTSSRPASPAPKKAVEKSSPASLRLASAAVEPPVPVPDPAPADPALVTATETMLQRSVIAQRDDSARISGLMFLLVGGAMVAMQHFHADVKFVTNHYVLVRNILVLAAVLLVTYNAAQDGIFRGLLCVVFPPYLLLYANSQEESGWVRGLFMGALLGVVAEAYLLPSGSLILGLGPAVNGVIEHVDGLLQLASKPPVIP